jgi:hypothetical protein
LDHTEDLTLPHEADFTLGRMDIDVYLIRRNADMKDGNGVAP